MTKTKDNVWDLLPPLWHAAITQNWSDSTEHKLAQFLSKEESASASIYPPAHLRWSAFDRVSLSQVRVVILGQDPYHGPLQAEGLSFSVPKGVKIPPSLRNIYKELAADCLVPTPSHGCLHAWADQGVLLLNTVLSVRAGQPGSHQKQGWEEITDRVLGLINDQPGPVVFMLWGSFAQRKTVLLNNPNHLVLLAPHPSPLSSYRGFFGCAHFSKTNAFLESKNNLAINWMVPG